MSPGDDEQVGAWGELGCDPVQPGLEADAGHLRVEGEGFSFEAGQPCWLLSP